MILSGSCEVSRYLNLGTYVQQLCTQLYQDGRSTSEIDYVLNLVLST
eukprot:SAG31_NODE_861_length_11418_cov_5.107430_8_plen_47_part_00